MATNDIANQLSVLVWYTLGLGRFGFFKFGSIRFGFQTRVPGFGFFRFRLLHISARSAMKAHAVGKASKGSEAVYAFTPSTSRIDDQQLGLLLTCITGCKRQAKRYLKAPTARTVESRKRPPLFSD